jgi:hypothetical protein
MGWNQDGNERQVIKDMDGSLPRAKIKSCSICDPFVLILREDESIGLFIGETERGKIRRKDMSPMGDKVFLTSFTLFQTIYRFNIDISLYCRLFLHGYYWSFRRRGDRNYPCSSPRR